MNPNSTLVQRLLAAAAAGGAVLLEPGLVSSLLLETHQPQDGSITGSQKAHQLQPAHIVRLLFHAAAAAGQVEVRPQEGPLISWLCALELLPCNSISLDPMSNVT